MNPTALLKKHLPLFVEHNRRFFQETDMTIAPMVLDRDQPTAEVKDAFAQFAPDGFSTIVMYPAPGGKLPTPQVWKGMPIRALSRIEAIEPGQAARNVEEIIAADGGKTPSLHIIRVVWTTPTFIANTVAALRRNRPDLNVEIVDPYTLFALCKLQEGR